jgi:hypothetical protein
MEDAPSTDSLVVRVAFNRHERTAAQRAAMNRGPLLRRPLVLLPAIGIGSALIAWAQGALGRALHSGGSSVAGTVVMALLVTGVVVYTVKFVKRQGEEVERHEAHPDVYTLNDAGLEVSGVEDLAFMSWSSMTRVHETDRFFLFVAGSEVQYLPKHALDQAQLDVVRGLVLRHAPAGRSLLARTGA